MSNSKKVTASSGNVFADLGFDNPEEELLKAKLVREIRGIIKRRKLTQTKAAAVLGLKQPDVSALVTGRVGKFSIDRLVRCLDRLDYKVDVVVRHKPRRASSRAIGPESSARGSPPSNATASASKTDGGRIDECRFDSRPLARYLNCARLARTRTRGPMSRCQIVPLSNWMVEPSGE